MIKDWTAERLNVTGKSRAIVVEGPSPGRTPTSVPHRTPMKHMRRFMGSKAMEKAI
jgi:hypothetical protein